MVSRCLDDVDDEVRDRAALYLRTFRDQALADVYVREGKSPGMCPLSKIINLCRIGLLFGRTRIEVGCICKGP
jgi:hypothetical protein